VVLARVDAACLAAPALGPAAWDAVVPPAEPARSTAERRRYRALRGSVFGPRAALTGS